MRAQQVHDIVDPNEAGRQAELELGEFSYVVAHDLSTEFRHVTEFAKLLLQDASVENSSALRNAQIVATTAQRCQAMLEAIVIYSVIQRRPLAQRRCNAEALVEKALREAEQEPGAHTAMVDINVAGELIGDEYLIECALRLAIANALQFPKAGVELKVDISGGPSADGGWVFQVADNGIGLAREYQEKAFQMFWKLERHRVSTSLGAGLAIIRRILRRHGGDARFVERAGAGACLELRLPGREI